VRVPAPEVPFSRAATGLQPDGVGVDAKEMDQPRQRRRSKTAVRAVSVALCVVLAALAGVAIMGGVAAERSADRLMLSGDLVEGYLNLTRAVAVQDASEEQSEAYRRKASRAQFDAAGVAIGESLAVLERLGDPQDRALGARIGRYERRYAADVHHYFDALDAGDPDHADAFETAADPSAQALQTLVAAGGPTQASNSLRGIDDLRSSQATVLRMTLISILLGIGVLAALWLVLRSLRGKIDEATHDELQRLAQTALTDSLTGIRNHRAFEEDLARLLGQRRREGTALSLVRVDLNGLKTLNDGQGHQAGDRALQAVRDMLSDAVRSGDAVYRIGKDEFAALLPGASTWGAFNFAQRLHRLLQSTVPPVTVSVGLAEACELSTRDGLIAQADIALLEAKTNGRQTIIFVPGMEHPDMTDPDEARRHCGTLASALARAVDTKDSYTRSHSETVAELCALVATKLGLSREQVAATRLAGLVHDVGKIGVPDAILHNPAQLDEDEYAIIKTHSALGHKILDGTDLTEQAPWVLHHHERLDGGGYPGGLVGDEIPLESRIIHVADAFEAMTSDRPYRRGIPEQEALDELHRHTGTQFDPTCVAALQSGLRVASAAPKPALAR